MNRLDDLIYGFLTGAFNDDSCIKTQHLLFNLFQQQKRNKLCKQ